MREQTAQVSSLIRLGEPHDTRKLDMLKVAVPPFRLDFASVPHSMVQAFESER
jgi:hypothetical protein